MIISPMDLPEILDQIIGCRSVLNLDDLASCSVVCRVWERASRKAMWQEVELVSVSWEDPRYCLLAVQLSKYGSFVKTLILDDCGADKSRFRELLLMMPNVQTIIMDRLMLQSHSLILLRTLEALPFSRLRYFRLPHVSTTMNEIDPLLQIFESAFRIQHLELMDSDVDDATLSLIAEACPNLKSLDLSRNEVVTFGQIFGRYEEGCEKNGQFRTIRTSTQKMAIAPTATVPSMALLVDTQPESSQGSSAASVYHPSDIPRSKTNNNINNHPYSCSSTQGGGDTVIDDARVALSTLWGTQEQLQQTTLQLPNLEAHGPSLQRQRIRKNRQILPNLLQLESPFMHLEELCLVFCIGISNKDFETLFRSFQGSRLRLLNLQFTNIEDAGLETLARTFGDISSALTAIKLGYCSKITSRGIRAIVERCPQLLELDFLGCDLVSADCFRGPTWLCTRLRQLEFTLHPKVLMPERNDSGGETSQEQGDPTAVSGMTLTQTTMHMLGNQQQKNQIGNENDRLSWNMEKQGAIDGGNNNQQLIRGESVESDYHAMFKQLGKLTELRSLHIYNNAIINNGPNSGHEYQDEPSGHSIPQGTVSALPEEPLVSFGTPSSESIALGT
ncbi:hypothetical protein BGX34_001137, partial [Mortierella sp. NVP85]